MLYVLDSSVLIDYLRNRPVVQRVEGLMRRRVDLATTAVNVDEVVRGMRPGEEGTVTTLFDALVVLPVGREAAWQAGQWRRTFARQGVTLSQADCLIAAVTHLASGTLATGNLKDFPMGEVVIEEWPVGR